MKTKRIISASLALIISFGASFLLSSCGKNEASPSVTDSSGYSVSSQESTSGKTDESTTGSANPTSGAGTSSLSPFQTTSGFQFTSAQSLPDGTTAPLTTVHNDDVTAPREVKDKRVNEFWGIDSTTKPSGGKTETTAAGNSGGNNETTTKNNATTKNNDDFKASSEFVEDLGSGFSVYDIKAKESDGEIENLLIMVYFFKGRAYPVDGDSYDNDIERQEVLNEIHEDFPKYKKNLAGVQTYSVLVWDTLFSKIASGDMDVDSILQMIEGLG